MNFAPALPILRIFHETKAREFCIGFLGCKIDWEHRFEAGLPLYSEISRGGCVHHLSEHHGDCSPAAAMRIKPTELDAFHAELLAKSYKFARPDIKKNVMGEPGVVGKRPVWHSADVHQLLTSIRYKFNSF